LTNDEEFESIGHLKWRRNKVSNNRKEGVKKEHKEKLTIQIKWGGQMK